MKNILLFFLICFSFFLQIVNAQVPGYQGKKFIAGYSTYVVPNYMLIFSDYKFNTSVINLRHNISAEYIVGRKLVLGGSLEYSKINYTYDKLGYFDEQRYNSNFVPEIRTAAINNFAYGIHVTTYGISNNPVAPIGDYVRFRLFKSHFSTTIPDIDEYFNSDKTPESKSFSTYGIGIGYGQTRVFYNKLLIDIGVEGSWLTSNSGFTPNNSSDLSFPENESLRALFWNYMVGFKIGASGLFF